MMFINVYYAMFKNNIIYIYIYSVHSLVNRPNDGNISSHGFFPSYLQITIAETSQV